LYAAFHARPAWLDLRSALTEALFEAEEKLSADPGTPWILKPSITNKGAGIVIVKSLEEVEAAVCEERDVGQWVLQRYVQNTLLLPISSCGRHKFHIRLYAVAVGALEVHCFREALLLIAPSPYTSDTSRTSSHITNTVVSIASEDFVEDIHVRCLSELPTMLGGGAEVGERASTLFSRMLSIVAHCFAAMEGKTGGFQPLPTSWELYGVDFLVREDWSPVLLEFNPTPDVKQTGSRLDGVIEGMFDGLLKVALDSRVLRPNSHAVGIDSHHDAAPLVLTPAAPGASVCIDTEPRIPKGGCHDNGVAKEFPAWYPGCSGIPIPHTAIPRVDTMGHSGWDCVYSKKWIPAHNSFIRIH